MRLAMKMLCPATTIALLAAGSVAFAQSDPKPAPKPWYEKVTVKGYLQFDSIFAEGGATAGANSNFRIRRARPTIGAQLDPLTRIQIQVDAGSGKAGAGNATVLVTDTFAERALPGFGLVRFGQYLLPFGSEVFEDNAAIRSPLEMSYTADAFALAERDIGVTLASSATPTDRTHWSVGLLNGQGFRSADANANKTLVGRVAHDIAPWLRLGVSGILGSYRAADGLDHDRHVIGAEAHVAPCDAVKLVAEFYNVRFVNSTTAQNPTDARFNGGYVLAEYNLPELSSKPFVRYQRTYGDLDYRSIDIGWRYQYTPTQRLTAEYDIVRASGKSSFGLRWQLGF